MTPIKKWIKNMRKWYDNNVLNFITLMKCKFINYIKPFTTKIFFEICYKICLPWIWFLIVLKVEYVEFQGHTQSSIYWPWLSWGGSEKQADITVTVEANIRNSNYRHLLSREWQSGHYYTLFTGSHD